MGMKAAKGMMCNHLFIGCVPKVDLLRGGLTKTM